MKLQILKKSLFFNACFRLCSPLLDACFLAMVSPPDDDIPLKIGSVYGTAVFLQPRQQFRGGMAEMVIPSCTDADDFRPHCR